MTEILCKSRLILIRIVTSELSVEFSCYRYVAEMMKNRIIRYFQQPPGVYHGSVFYQFQGGVGPSGIAVDRQGSIYVGHYDTRGLLFFLSFSA